MASPAVTYSYSNGSVADATQINQNFTDVINGITDGTKDLSISALTCAGNVSITGSSTLTIASGKVNKVTITAPATGSTLTIADGKTLTASNTLTFTGTDSSSVAFGAGGTVSYLGTAQTYTAIKTNTAQPAFLAYLGSAFTIASGDGTVLATFNTESFDQGSNFNNASSNYRFTVPTGGAGVYLFHVQMTFDGGSSVGADESYTIFLYKSGSVFKRSYNRFPTTSADTTFSVSAIVSLADADYIDVRCSTNSAVNITATAGADFSYFGGVKLF